jgi:serine/threonine protein kinase
MEPHSGNLPDLIIGQTIGNYLVTQKLGEGGMGSVYLAEHPHIGKKVALKVLHAEFASNQDVVSRFFNEAKAVNDIQHPNIVDIIDYGVLQHGTSNERLVYFIMEYLSGATLSQLIRAEAPLPPERTFAIGLQVADALAASHHCGIIHRDLKPDNIILGQRGRERDFVKLLDFGIAKLTGDQPGSRRTRTGIVMGTPAYMSPEQCDGRGLIDQRTDVYALGVVLYEMLTGRVPFLGEGYGEVLVQHLTQIPLRPSQFRMLPPHVEAVVLKALEKRPDLRFPTMEEVMRALADPVGYVEANDGLQGFHRKVLVASSSPVSVFARPTPSPLTPHPGSVPAMRAAPSQHGVLGVPGHPGGPNSQMSHLGQLAGAGPYQSGIHVGGAVVSTPTTLGGSAGQPATRSRTLGLVAAAVIAVAAIAIVVVATRSTGMGDPDRAEGTLVAQVAQPGSDAGAIDAVAAIDATAQVVDAVDAQVDATAQVVDAVDAQVDATRVEVDARDPARTPTVTFVIRTDPSGATVKIAGKTGETPFEVTLDRSLGEIDYSIALLGYYQRADRVDLSQRDISPPIYKLEKKRTSKPGPRKPPGTSPATPGSDTDLMRPPGT